MNELFGTADYWRRMAQGELDWSDAAADHQAHEARRHRARQAHETGARTRDPRENRPAPEPSRQWCRELDTTAARDDRLTHGAKVLLTIIVAEIGDHASRVLSKPYLAKRMNRSARTIQRYLAQLRQYGYLAPLEAIRSRAGWITGQRVRVMPRVRPFWHRLRRTWERMRDSDRETETSHTKPYGQKTNHYPTGAFRFARLE